MYEVRSFDDGMSFGRYETRGQLLLSLKALEGMSVEVCGKKRREWYVA